MRTFLKILKNTAFPLAVVIFAITLYFNPKYRAINIVDSMDVFVNSGTVDGSRYINEELGLIVCNNADEDAFWRAAEFTVTPYLERFKYRFWSIEAPLAELKTNENLTMVKIETEYISFKKARNTKKASMDYCRDKMHAFKTTKARIHGSDYSRNCKFTEISEIRTGGNVFYAFLCEDMFWKTATVVYCIRHGDFGFSFSFLIHNDVGGSGFDKEAITSILKGIEFTEPKGFYVTYSYGN